MELEKQCCTVEQAKELVQLGVKIKTINIWYFDTNLHEWKITGWETQYYWESSNLTIEWYPAYTVAELGILLSGYQIILTPHDGWQVFSPEGMAYGFLAEYCDDLPEAQARAHCLIWLIENNAINPEEQKL
jgi:hypothetical protein